VILRQRDYRDPAIILEERQARTCAGCAALERQEWLGAKKNVCGLGKQKGSTDIAEMRRCRDYIETGRSTVGMKEQIVSAAQSKDLAWHADFVKSIDRLTAFGMSDQLGAALWRVKYLYDATTYNRALYLLVKKARARLRAQDLNYLIKMAKGVLKEWLLEACDRCNGTGAIVERTGMTTKCSKCEGTGLKRHTDGERERYCELPAGSWSRGHNRIFDEIMICLTGATAACGGQVRDLLKNAPEQL
jgi:hypothetical protein